METTDIPSTCMHLPNFKFMIRTQEMNKEGGGSRGQV